MHSATKFISGHSDLMAGVLAVRGERFFLYIVYVPYLDLLLSYGYILLVFSSLFLLAKNQ